MSVQRDRNETVRWRGIEVLVLASLAVWCLADRSFAGE